MLRLHVVVVVAAACKTPNSECLCIMFLASVQRNLKLIGQKFDSAVIMTLHVGKTMHPRVKSSTVIWTVTHFVSCSRLFVGIDSSCLVKHADPYYICIATFVHNIHSQSGSLARIFGA